jgi:acetyl/propionyl-CoA carboxylase alpha subunit
VYGEDSRRLLPQSGRLLRYREPSGEGIRVDSGVSDGQTIGVHYDALIAKVIAHADSREAARTRMLQALGAFEVLGVRTNLGLLRRLLEEPDVVAGRAGTRFIDEHLAAWIDDAPVGLAQAAAALAAWLAVPHAPFDERAPSPLDPWSNLGQVRW